MKWLKMELLNIDKQATKDKLEEELGKYMFYKLELGEEILPNITASYSLVPPSNTNAFNSSTENIATKRILSEEKKIAHIQKVESALKRIGNFEREIIKKHYLSNEYVTDAFMSNEYKMSARTYSRIKSTALYKLAFALRVAVYIKE